MKKSPETGGCPLKLLHTSHNLILIDRIRSVLNEHGIPHIVRNENLQGQAAGEVPPAVCWPEVLVRDETDYLKAKGLIEQLTATRKKTALAWICPNCNERLEPQFEICWSCQGAHPEA